MAGGAPWPEIDRQESRALPTATTESHTKKGMLPDTSTLEDRPKMTQVISRIFSPKLPMAQHVLRSSSLRAASCSLTDPTPLVLHFWWTVLVRFLGSWLDLLVLLPGLHLPSHQSRHSLHAPCPLELWHQRLTESMDHQRQPTSCNDMRQ